MDYDYKSVKKDHAKVIDLYKEEKFNEARSIIDKIIEQSPESPEGISSRHLRASSIEAEEYSKNDIELAKEDYLFIDEHANVYSPEGALGYVWIVMKQESADVQQCLDLLKKNWKHGDSRVYMLTGLVYEELSKDYSNACKFYLKAFFRLQPWGLRFYAKLKVKQKKYLVGYFSHFLATLATPLLALIKGLPHPSQVFR